MDTQIIKVVRVMNMEVKYGQDGEKSLVPRMTIEREQKPEIYDINYDGNGQKYMIPRGW
jgi:hypothetical protein